MQQAKKCSAVSLFNPDPIKRCAVINDADMRKDIRGGTSFLNTNKLMGVDSNKLMIYTRIQKYMNI